MFFGTFVGVREVNGERLWEIQYNNKDIYSYNLSQVLDAQDDWLVNMDFNNDDKDDEPPVPPAKKPKNKNKNKKKPKTKRNKKRTKKG